MLRKMISIFVLGLALAGCVASVPDNRNDDFKLMKVGLAISAPTIVRTSQRSIRFEVTLRNETDGPICVDYDESPGQIGIEMVSASGSWLLTLRDPPEIGLGLIDENMRRVYGVIEPGQSVKGFGIVSDKHAMEFVDEKTMATIRDYQHGEPLLARAWVSVFPCRLKHSHYPRQQRAMKNVTSKFTLKFHF